MRNSGVDHQQDNVSVNVSVWCDIMARLHRKYSATKRDV
jgi:hypothetical protein